MTFFACSPSRCTVCDGRIDISASATLSFSPSSALRTASKRFGAVYTVTRSPSRSTSSAPASMAWSSISSASFPFASISMMPFCSKSHCTEPDSPSFPLWRVNAARTSAAVRFRLSVAASTMIETPPGP